MSQELNSLLISHYSEEFFKMDMHSHFKTMISKWVSKINFCYMEIESFNLVCYEVKEWSFPVFLALLLNKCNKINSV